MDFQVWSRQCMLYKANRRGHLTYKWVSILLTVRVYVYIVKYADGWYFPPSGIFDVPLFGIKIKHLIQAVRPLPTTRLLSKSHKFTSPAILTKNNDRSLNVG